MATVTKRQLKAVVDSLQWAMQYVQMPEFHPSNSYNKSQWSQDYAALKDTCEEMTEVLTDG